MHNWLKYIFFTFILSLLVACGNQANGSHSGYTSVEDMSQREKTIRVATSLDPSSDLFFDEIAPVLEKAGYIVEEHGFNTVEAASAALAKDEVDLHVEQSKLFMENYNTENETDFVSLTDIPSVPMTIYPANKRSFGEVAEGDRVGLPKDPPNRARGLKLLEEADLIVLDDTVALDELTIDDVEENIYGIDIQLMYYLEIPEKLDDLEYAIIPGALMFEHDLNFYTALLVEESEPDAFLQAVVDSEDEDSQWAQLVKEAYNDEEFLEEVEKINEEVGSMRWIIP